MRADHEKTDAKKQKLRALYLKIPFRLMTKKNGHVIRKTKSGRYFIANKSDFLAWQEHAIACLLTQTSEKFSKNDKLFVATEMYMDKGQRFDIDNAEGAIFDVLQKSGIVVNDNKIIASLKRKRRVPGMVGARILVCSANHPVYTEFMSSYKSALNNA